MIAAAGNDATNGCQDRHDIMRHVRVIEQSKPISQAVAVLCGAPYSYFRYELHRAVMQALPVYEESAREFAVLFGRRHPAVETYRCEDAEIVYFMIGSFATKAKDAIDRQRDSGLKVGLVRPRLLRPYPADALRHALAGKRAVAVIDQKDEGSAFHAPAWCRHRDVRRLRWARGAA